MCQILQVIASGDSKLADKVLGGTLQIAIILTSVFLFRSTKISIRRDGRGALKTLKPLLSLGLCIWVEGSFAKELI
jgi:hypothetical protein